MNKNLKIILFGFLAWLIIFLVSFIIFPLKTSMNPLFESIMAVTVALIVVIFSYLYLNDLKSNFVKESIIIGLTWLIINLAVDLIMFMPASPMHKSFIDYMMDIGITYIMIPVITIGMGYIAQNKSQ